MLVSGRVYIYILYVCICMSSEMGTVSPVDNAFFPVCCVYLQPSKNSSNIKLQLREKQSHCWNYIGDCPSLFHRESIMGIPANQPVQQRDNSCFSRFLSLLSFL